MARLARGEAGVLEVAAPFAMSQPAVSKHLKVLERAGLISRHRDGQRRLCRLEPQTLKGLSEWIGSYRDYWETALSGSTPISKACNRMETSDERAADGDRGAGGEPVITYRRFVPAPPELVFEAWTKPEHLTQWLGPAYLELSVCEIDLRVGGAYRFVHRAPDGTEHGFHGEYLEVVRPSQ